MSPEVKIKRFCLERRPSPIGTLLLVTDDDDALRALDFGDNEPRMHRLLHQHYKVYSLEDGPAPATAAKALTDYFEGDMSAIKYISVITGGTAFQREVWKGLRGITAGATKSYGQLAAQLGHPGASRAVGLANGANPVGIVVTCHRVIGANGALAGYGGGLMRKRWLLDHERRHSGAELQQHLLSRDR